MFNYKPREGQWAWLFHRVSGAAIFLFLFGHILSTSVMLWGPHGPQMHAKLDAFYRNPVFTLLFHPLLFAAVLYHALNGIRIIVIDFYSKSTGIHRRLFYAEMVVFAALMVCSVFWMILPEWEAYRKAASGVSLSPPVAAMSTEGRMP
jgi:succinate dehydrogenase / fumarate reductase cytochrome b subunit